MSSLINLPWLGRVLMMFALLGGAYWAGARVERHHNVAEQAQQALRLERVQQQISMQADAAHQASQTVVHTVFKDRIVYRNQEKVREITLQQDRHCAVPQRFVSLWNSANRLYVPDTAGLTDGSFSDVKLSDIEAQHEREAQLCHKTAEQLKALQQWVQNQQALNEDH